VCNHPDLFEARPITSSFDQAPIRLHYPSIAIRALESLHEELEIDFHNLRLVTREEMTKLEALRREQLRLSVSTLNDLSHCFVEGKNN
jgi:hypothetical protein